MQNMILGIFLYQLNKIISNIITTTKTVAKTKRNFTIFEILQGCRINLFQI